jgi:hypothetical protein
LPENAAHLQHDEILRAHASPELLEALREWAETVQARSLKSKRTSREGSVARVGGPMKKILESIDNWIQSERSAGRALTLPPIGHPVRKAIVHNLRKTEFTAGASPQVREFLSSINLWGLEAMPWGHRMAGEKFAEFIAQSAEEEALLQTSWAPISYEAASDHYKEWKRFFESPGDFPNFWAAIDAPLKEKAQQVVNRLRQELSFGELVHQLEMEKRDVWIHGKRDDVVREAEVYIATAEGLGFHSGLLRSGIGNRNSAAWRSLGPRGLNMSLTEAIWQKFVEEGVPAGISRSLRTALVEEASRRSVRINFEKAPAQPAKNSLEPQSANVVTSDDLSAMADLLNDISEENGPSNAQLAERLGLSESAIAAIREEKNPSEALPEDLLARIEALYDELNPPKKP